MAQTFEIFHGLAGEMPAIPAGSIATRTVFESEQVQVVVLGFAAGQELSEPAPDMPAILEVWRGEGLLVINEEAGESAYELAPGSWVYISDETPHVIQASTEMVILLTELK